MTTILLAMLVLGVLGGIFGGLLAFASQIFYVKVDPKQAAVREVLAGANCGGCGYPGCDGYAAAVAKGEAPCNRCVAGGAETAAKVAEIMGASNETSEKMVAFVPCSGCEGVAEKRFNYTGPEDCQAAMLFGGKSNKLCTFACIGLGNCVDTCPKSIVKLIPESQRIMPACSSHDKGAAVMKVCTAGCIGCMKCQRECPEGAIVVNQFLAEVDPAKCIGCGKCAEVCPRHIIVDFTK